MRAELETDLWILNHGECAVQLADRIEGRGSGGGRLSPSSFIGGLVPGDQLILVNERALAGIRSEEVSRRIGRMTIARIQFLNSTYYVISTSRGSIYRLF